MSDAYSGRFGEDRETELKQLYAKIVSDITTLMRLAMAIREPALDSEGRTMSKSYYQQRDEKHVQEKFPNMPIGYLTERLGRAITSRRQYIADREAHQQKLSERIELLGLQDLGTEHGTSSTEATKMQEPGAHDLVPGGEDDTLSQTSYATSVNATIRAPRLPKIARSKDDSPEAFGILKRTSARIADLSERVTCPACQKTMSLRALQKHLAHHQEELALFAIPSYEEESDDQAEDQTQIPPNSEEESDKGLTDVDDVSDPEEERDKKAIDIQPRSFNDQDDIPRSGNLSVFNLSERWFQMKQMSSLLSPLLNPIKYRAIVGLLQSTTSLNEQSAADALGSLPDAIASLT
ncbi:hypothetical protein N0V86_005726 [Didymella sp. IMI 355093]|nr:hypothetical protein N0V86_005726 [Didymella sp. IMI 355093]